MPAQHFQIILRPNRRERLTLDDVARHARMHPAFVERVVEFGLLMPIEVDGDQLFFDPSAASRLRAIVRLREDLGINLPGISVILDLVDKLCCAQRENERLGGRRIVDISE